VYVLHKKYIWIKFNKKERMISKLKLSSLLFIFSSYTLLAQLNSGPTSAAPTPPERNPEDVISIYSDAYENNIIDNFDFGLCPNSGANEEIIAGNAVQHYYGPGNAGCQGISVENNRINAAAFTNLHFDFYTNETNLTGKVFNVKLVDWNGNIDESNSTGLEVIFNGGTNPQLTSGSWISVDVDISSNGAMVLGNLNRSDIAQIHITSNLANAWYDNLYLYKEVFIPGTCSDGILNQDEQNIDCGGVCDDCILGPPTSPAPTPPSREPSNVISIYSDAYENITIDNFDFGLCPNSGANEEMIADNVFQHYTGPGCQGILFENNRINAAAFSKLHFDFYTDETNLIGKVFNVKLVDWNGNVNASTSTGLEINFNGGSIPALTSGSWISVDVDITSAGIMVGGNLTRSDIAEIHITSNLASAWYDNLYIYRDELIPGTCNDGVQNQDETGIDCGGSSCEPCSVSLSGCMDANATNYNPAATSQALDQYGNLICIFNSCDDVPQPGCIYADGFGLFNAEFGAEACVTYGGTPCSNGSTGTSGCMDANATNYNAAATTQALDQYGNLTCIFNSCDDVPQPGCIYADGFGLFNAEFGANDCVTYGGTPCTDAPGVSIDEHEDYVLAYPNPAHNFVTLTSLLLLDASTTIKLHDLVGNLVLSIETNNANSKTQVIDVSRLSKGTYILSISNTKEMSNQILITE
jgi:hypothetical protein